MSQLTPIMLDDKTTIYIETTEDVEAPEIKRLSEDDEESLEEKGDGMKAVMERFESIQSTIRSYATYTLNAFENFAAANVDKVSLEFGIKVGGEVGIPYVTKGTAESNLKVTVECSFPEQENADNRAPGTDPDTNPDADNRAPGTDPDTNLDTDPT